MDASIEDTTLDERAQFFENRDGRALFSMLHLPRRRSSAGWGVVFCHPRGEEKQKSYRAYVQFARALARAGIASLRFDACGFGDSEGEIREATVESQIADTRDAMQWFRKQCGIDRFVLIGARIGASVAALLAATATEVAALVLVSPVVTGERCWSEVVQAQQLSCVTRGIKPKKKSEMLADLEETGFVEIDADYLSAACARQLAAIDLQAAAHSIRVPTAIAAVATAIADREASAALAATLRQRGVRVAEWLDEPREFWTNDALYSGYLPLGLYERTIAWLQELAL